MGKSADESPAGSSLSTRPWDSEEFGSEDLLGPFFSKKVLCTVSWFGSS